MLRYIHFEELNKNYFSFLFSFYLAKCIFKPNISLKDKYKKTHRGKILKVNCKS